MGTSLLGVYSSLMNDIFDFLNDLPEEVKRGKYFLEFADKLFKENGKSRDVEFLSNDTTVLIVIDGILTLWFLKKEQGSGYVYDGWELGDYN